jgi:hypothetical protein
MEWFERFVAGKSVVLEDAPVTARDVGVHGLVVTSSNCQMLNERAITAVQTRVCISVELRETTIEHATSQNSVVSLKRVTGSI